MFSVDLAVWSYGLKVFLVDVGPQQEIPVPFIIFTPSLGWWRGPTSSGGVQVSIVHQFVLLMARARVTGISMQPL